MAELSIEGRRIELLQVPIIQRGNDPDHVLLAPMRRYGLYDPGCPRRRVKSSGRAGRGQVHDSRLTGLRVGVNRHVMGIGVEVSSLESALRRLDPGVADFVAAMEYVNETDRDRRRAAKKALQNAVGRLEAADYGLIANRFMGSLKRLGIHVEEWPRENLDMCLDIDGITTIDAGGIRILDVIAAAVEHDVRFGDIDSLAHSMPHDVIQYGGLMRFEPLVSAMYSTIIVPLDFTETIFVEAISIGSAVHVRRLVREVMSAFAISDVVGVERVISELETLVAATPEPLNRAFHNLRLIDSACARAIASGCVVFVDG